MRPIILLDLDAVLFDFHGALHDHVARIAQEMSFENTLPQEFDTWALFNGHKETDEAISRSLNSPGFFGDMPVMPGAVEAVAFLREYAEVFFCSTPFHTNPTCAEEKSYAVNKHFGKGSGQRLILTSDKTVISGEVLVDDRPDVKGVLSHYHDWTQVFFTHKYNSHIEGVPRIREWNDESTRFILDVAKNGWDSGY